MRGNGLNARSMRENTIREYRQQWGIVLVYREDIGVWHRVDTTRAWMSDGPIPLGPPCVRAEDAAWAK